jgi:hypothetical protein
MEDLNKEADAAADAYARGMDPEHYAPFLAGYIAGRRVENAACAQVVYDRRSTANSTMENISLANAAAAILARLQSKPLTEPQHSGK